MLEYTFIKKRLYFKSLIVTNTFFSVPCVFASYTLDSKWFVRLSVSLSFFPPLVLELLMGSRIIDALL